MKKCYVLFESYGEEGSDNVSCISRSLRGAISNVLHAVERDYSFLQEGGNPDYADFPDFWEVCPKKADWKEFMLNMTKKEFNRAFLRDEGGYYISKYSITD